MALLLLAGCAFLALAAAGGAAPLAMAAAASATALAWAALGRAGSLDALAAPSLAGAAVGWGLALLAAPRAVAAWEAALGREIAEGGEAALARYGEIGMSAETLAALESMPETAALWTVRLWPAIAGLALWLGAWFGFRILARWGKIAPDLALRLVRRPFTTFAVGQGAAWLLIFALAGLWVSAADVERLAANAAVVAAALFFVDGLAVVWWWLDRRGVPPALRIVAAAIALVFALPLVAAGLFALGLVDLWLQLRHRPRAALGENAR